MQYLPLVRRNLPQMLSKAFLDGLPEKYLRAETMARDAFAGNVAFHRGVNRFGLTDDLLFACAQMAGCYVRRVSSNNSMTHVEVYTAECIFIQGKSAEPGQPRTARYINDLAAKSRQYRVFEDIEEIVERVTGDDRLVVQITHTPDTEDPSMVAYVTVIVEDATGVVDHFPLSSVHREDGGDVGIEIVPDNVVTPPKAGGATGTAR